MKFVIDTQDVNKKDFVKKFLKENIKIIWPKEIKMVKLLLNIFPNKDFWDNLEVGFKLNSICWFLSDDGRNFLNKEYKKFNFNLSDKKQFEIENNNIDYQDKIPYYSDKVLNLRQFLNLWQKKVN